LALVACGEPHDHSDHGHAAEKGHNHAAPYGGALVELGDHEFQVNLLLDAESGKLEAYLFDGHAEHAVPSAMTSLTVRATVDGKSVTIVLQPVANPYADDEQGKSSKFAGQSDALKKLEEFEGELESVTIAGKTFEAVAFHYHPDQGHDH